MTEFVRAVRHLVHKLECDEAGPKPCDATRGEFWPYDQKSPCGWPIQLSRVRQMLEKFPD